MLENIDFTQKIDKQKYKEIITDLEIKLGSLQQSIRTLNIPIIIIFEGWDASGKGVLISNLIQSLDPRGFKVFLTKEPDEEEKMYPFLWSFWKKTPAKGQISIFDKSWYERLIFFKNNFKKNISINLIEEINQFEKQLTDDKNIIIKFFLHIEKNEQKKRFKKLDNDPITTWKITKKEWERNKNYNKLLEIYENILSKTNNSDSLWNIVDSTDKRYATVFVYKTIIEALEKSIDKNNKPVKEKVIKYEKNPISVLDKVNLDLNLSKEEYEKTIDTYQDEFRDLEFKIYKKRLPVLILFEGWDAAGKGGNIKRITRHLDPRGYEVVPVSAPNDLEKSHHYLWRFWQNIPKAGHITIFDRTWYGRVLVERIEKFCAPEQWLRSYKEINDTEKQLTDSGIILLKFWLQIDKEEQLKRFNERQNTPTKNWKITEDDWRNREKWDLYKSAVDEMLIKTSTSYSPWTIVESNSKYYARIKTLTTIIDEIKKKL